MSIDKIAQIVGIIGTIGPILLQLVPPARKWLFITPPPLARASLAGLGGLFGAGLVFLFIAANPLAFVTVTNGQDLLAVNSNTGWSDVHASCGNDIAIGAYCYTTSGYSTLVKSGVDNGQAHCAWKNPFEGFQGRIRAICLQANSK